MLDYETQQIVEIIVIASDSVPAPDKKSSNVTITIFVEDANDNRPDFQQGSYSEALSEDTSLNTVLGVNIVAIDTDTGLGGVVEYSILSSNPLLSQELFEIDPTNGIYYSIHLLFHSFIIPFIHHSIHSLFHSFIIPFIHHSIYSLIHPCIHPSIYLSIHLFINPIFNASSFSYTSGSIRSRDKFFNKPDNHGTRQHHTISLFSSLSFYKC